MTDTWAELERADQAVATWLQSVLAETLERERPTLELLERINRAEADWLDQVLRSIQ